MQVTDLVDRLRDEEQDETFAHIGGHTVGAVRKFFGLCQRCGERPADGSGVMCRECWIETGKQE